MENITLPRVEHSLDDYDYKEDHCEREVRSLGIGLSERFPTKHERRQCPRRSKEII